MSTQSTTLRIQKSKISFLEEYAKRHNVTVAKLIDEYILLLRISDKYSYHPDIDKFIGIIPDAINLKDIYFNHVMEKHK